MDTSTRGQLVGALTEGLRLMRAEGDGEGVPVALRAIEDIARLVSSGKKAEDRVTDSRKRALESAY